MNFNLQEIRAQMSPAWTPVNIALMVMLFWIFWPFGLAMVAYIVWGDRIGLDFSRTGSFANLAHQLKQGVSAFAEGFGNNRARNTGTQSPGTPASERDSFERWRQQEQSRLQAERDELERQKKDFQTQKNEFNNRAKEES